MEAIPSSPLFISSPPGLLSSSELFSVEIERTPHLKKPQESKDDLPYVNSEVVKNTLEIALDFGKLLKKIFEKQRKPPPTFQPKKRLLKKVLRPKQNFAKKKLLDKRNLLRRKIAKIEEVEEKHDDSLSAEYHQVGEYDYLDQIAGPPYQDPPREESNFDAFTTPRIKPFLDDFTASTPSPRHTTSRDWLSDYTTTGRPLPTRPYSEETFNERPIYGDIYARRPYMDFSTRAPTLPTPSDAGNVPRPGNWPLSSFEILKEGHQPSTSYEYGSKEAIRHYETFENPIDINNIKFAPAIEPNFIRPTFDSATENPYISRPTTSTLEPIPIKSSVEDAITNIRNGGHRQRYHINPAKKPKIKSRERATLEQQLAWVDQEIARLEHQEQQYFENQIAQPIKKELSIQEMIERGFDNVIDDLTDMFGLTNDNTDKGNINFVTGGGGYGQQEKPQQNSYGNGSEGNEEVSDDNSNPLSGVLGPLNVLSGDQSLSRVDFESELFTWFRRAIWFLLYTAAFYVNPNLLIVAIALSIVFEVVLNINFARDAFSTVLGQANANRRVVGLPEEDFKYDIMNWRYLLGLPPDFLWSQEEKMQKWLNDGKKNKREKGRRRKKNKKNHERRRHKRPTIKNIKKKEL